VVDNRGNTAVGVVLGCVLWSFMLTLPKIQEYCLICQAKFLENDGDLPVRSARQALQQMLGNIGYMPAIRTTVMGVERKMLAMRHGKC
jgi:hypothetical protein